MLRLNFKPILQSTIWIALITIVVKLLGYVEKLILAYYFGTSYQVDVYNIVVSIILGFFFLFREIAEPVFLNVFIKVKEQEGINNAWKFLNSSLRYVSCVAIVLSILILIFPHGVITMFAPGFDMQKKDLAIRFIQIAFPAVVFLSLTVLTNIALNGVKQFALPALGDLVFKVVIVLSITLLYKYWNIYAAAFGIVVAACFKLMSHWLILFDKISFRKLSIRQNHGKEIWNLSWPLILGATFSQVSSFADNIFVSFLKTGSISALSYSRKLVELPVLIFPYVLSVVVFPYFSQFSVSNQKEKLSSVLSTSLAWIAIVFFPLSVFFYVFSVPVIDLVFGHGAFDRNSVLLTALPFKWYASGLVFFAVETILVVFYFANGNIKFPVRVGILCVVEHILIIFLLIQSAGYIIIPIALVLSKATKVFVLLYKLDTIIPVNRRMSAIFVVKVLVASAGLALSLVFLQSVIDMPATQSFFKRLFALVMYFGVACSVYFTLLLLLGFKKKFLFG